ncbi:uncharacterized protein L969DRAFT_614927 [Mixia osmundae IAM 14324]|uniref:Opi1-domain-containing protein n=1 Tax=Mixia osmundae (strain CBS 9802 / IAM 14324 / JCM 22182 / KY 12970) TaxID=764103 RepID=G7DY25_MIXOS|nr:uncharacterized protein L969DRAFT_614927 [Mixia osmundae IAM 14324]KEI41387.1 hypothetical protein L969DRAFT_614927 [Mixia osmundae IAM 14324]GAA95485.1 hypothetical protein E5Q_02140 [Mixia osmundae IAM 14324]
MEPMSRSMSIQALCNPTDDSSENPAQPASITGSSQIHQSDRSAGLSSALLDRQLSSSTSGSRPNSASSSSFAASPIATTQAKTVDDEEDTRVLMAITALGKMRTGSFSSAPATQPPASLRPYLDTNGAQSEAYASNQRGNPVKAFSQDDSVSSSSQTTLDSETGLTTSAQSLLSYSADGAQRSSMATPSSAATEASSIASSVMADEDAIYMSKDGMSVEGGKLRRYPDEHDEHGGDETLDEGDARFLDRMSQFPIVSGALKAYERGRNSSRVVKYGADLVESSVKTISRPVIGRVVGPELAGQIDDFACRQLDRFGKARPPNDQASPTEEGESSRTPIASQTNLLAMSTSAPQGFDEHHSGRLRAGESSSAAAHRYVAPDEGIFKVPQTPLATASRNSAPVSVSDNGKRKAISQSLDSPDESMTADSSVALHSSGSRSRWQAMLVEAGVTAGGISAAVSEESMKSLKYCLQWLQYATAHLDHQIGVLRDFIAALNADAAEGTMITAHSAATLSNIKRDVVETIRRVVDVVSKYAGAALPEHAKRFVRQSILSLPVKWAAAIQQPAANRQRPSGLGSRSPTPGSPMSAASPRMGASPQMFGSSPASPSFSPSHASGGYFAQRRSMLASSAGSPSQSMSRSASSDRGASSRTNTEEAAERVLTFAVESLDMLRGVMIIFGESVDRAEAWVERLRLVGLAQQRKRQAMEDNVDEFELSNASAGHASASPEDSTYVQSTSTALLGSSSSTKRRRVPSTADQSQMPIADGFVTSPKLTSTPTAAFARSDLSARQRRSAVRSTGDDDCDALSAPASRPTMQVDQ